MSELVVGGHHGDEPGAGVVSVSKDLIVNVVCDLDGLLGVRQRIIPCPDGLSLYLSTQSFNL